MSGTHLNELQYERRYDDNNTCFFCLFCFLNCSNNNSSSNQSSICNRRFSTYKDPISLFTIQYPSNWKTVGQKVGNVTFTPQSPSDYSSNGRHVSSLTIAVTNENVSTLDQLVSKEKFELAHTPLVTARIVNESQVTLSGLPAHNIVTESVLSSTTLQFELSFIHASSKSGIRRNILSIPYYYIQMYCG